MVFTTITITNYKLAIIKYFLLILYYYVDHLELVIINSIPIPKPLLISADTSYIKKKLSSINKISCQQKVF